MPEGEIDRPVGVGQVGCEHDNAIVGIGQVSELCPGNESGDGGYRYPGARLRILEVLLTSSAAEESAQFLAGWRRAACRSGDWGGIGAASGMESPGRRPAGTRP